VSQLKPPKRAKASCQSQRACFKTGSPTTGTGRLWTYVRDDRPSGGKTAPAVWFASSPDRKSEHPRQHLELYKGALQAGVPGKPALGFAGMRKVLSVHGCFWHQHPDSVCKLARMPKSRLEFWAPKFEKNRLRDDRVGKELAEQGWQSLTIWECHLLISPPFQSR